MLLAVDIGNSNVKFGVFDGELPMGLWRVATSPSRTAAEYEFILPAEITNWPIDGVVIGSVVPQATAVLVELAITYFQLKPFLATTTGDVGMTIAYDPPGSLGVDRLADAVAAAHLLGAPCIAVDMGTATTFNVVAASYLTPALSLLRRGSSLPVFAGGAIAPGAGILAETLAGRTAQLPAVAFARPSTILATSSAEAIQAGLFHGYAAMVDGMVERLRAELISVAPLSLEGRGVGGPECPAIATGGGATADLIAECRTIARVEPLLTLHGLRLIWEHSHRS